MKSAPLSRAILASCFVFPQGYGIWGELFLLLACVSSFQHWRHTSSSVSHPDERHLQLPVMLFYRPDDLEVSRQDNLDDFEFGSCHNHWHFKDFTLYELINEDTNEIVTGRKQAFCLMDIRKMDSTVGSSQYGCSNQGITAGWADIYSYYLDGQWIDITGVPAGSYTLRVTINHGGLLNETNYTDNTDTVSSSEDSDLVITQQFPCNGGPPEPTSQPSESSQPTVSKLYSQNNVSLKQRPNDGTSKSVLPPHKFSLIYPFTTGSPL